MRSPVRLFGLLSLLGGLLVAAPPRGEAHDPARPDAVLYELTENMSLAPDGGGVLHRLAIAALQGTARLGTPLCPSEVLVTHPWAQRCTITAVGEDDISTETGQGTLGGTWATVVQGDNPVDGPEFVVLTGKFQGDINLSPTAVGIPLGFITNGCMTIDGTGATCPVSDPPQVGAISFVGTFRLPFSRGKSGDPEKPVRGKDAFYLGDNGKPFPVRKDEHSLGIPTVRLEIQFVP